MSGLTKRAGDTMLKQKERSSVQPAPHNSTQTKALTPLFPLPPTQTPTQTQTSTMPATTRTTLLLVATVALLVVGTTMASKNGLVTRLRQQQRQLLTEGCPTGTGATNDACTSGADCASGYCFKNNDNTGTYYCWSNCGGFTFPVASGDGCSCCSGAVREDQVTCSNPSA